ncbi:putative hydrolase mutT1 [Serinicoccus hydrothermalis]|uniref:Putative hydrolase mutT1 n=1 Tax=Serinicoccus hydrothermalis TaxID=1758689 RepID=A0A1B1NEX5_9MICO|nr:NUDIX hydrolase [Serinicoccus hydrothermalis]ANS79988.1 putative hydrolase mutT1 [Serinicoccus hydrothermalis]
MSGGGPPVVRAGGVLPVRRRHGKLEVALVHRPKYDDWSWPKGKLDRGEDFPSAAVRETWEETGLRVRLGMPLPPARYRLTSGPDKLVHYWTGEVSGGAGALDHEVDEVAWLSPKQASRRLSYPRDRDQLDALVALDDADRLATWSLLVVRHALAVPRSEWHDPDPRRPLTRPGRQRARGRVQALLSAYGPEVVLSSPSVRCTETVEPFAAAEGIPLTTKKGLSEEGFEAHPGALAKHVERVMAQGVGTALCTHGPLLPDLAGMLLARADASLESSDRRMLKRLAGRPMDKGEVLACTMLGAGRKARVVAVERHRPA